LFLTFSNHKKGLLILKSFLFFSQQSLMTAKGSLNQMHKNKME